MKAFRVPSGLNPRLAHYVQYEVDGALKKMKDDSVHVSSAWDAPSCIIRNVASVDA